MAVTWTFAGEPVADLLDSLRPGLERDGVLVPRDAFHDTVFEAGKRLLQAYAALPDAREHEVDWMIRALAAVELAKRPPAEVEEEADALYPAGFYGLQATLNTLAMLHMDRPAVMGETARWVLEALQWATKRHVRDRRCPHDPASLLADAARIQAAYAEWSSRDAAAAERAEREAQAAGFVAAAVL